MALHRENRFGNRPTASGSAPSRSPSTLTSDDFIEGVAHSGLYMLYTVPLGLLLGVLLAVAAHRRLKGIKVFQTIFSSTVATSVAVASVVFFTLVNPEVGYFKDVAWLSLRQPRHSALFAVSLSSVWQNLGLTFIVVLAALQAVPDELERGRHARRLRRGAAASSASPCRSSRPALLFLAVVLVVFALQAYAQIEILTGGGPGRRHRDRCCSRSPTPTGIRSRSG